MDGNPFKDAKYEDKPSGVILMDGKEVAHTLQCCHCAVHFVSIRGSGKRRGFCMHCHKITCGNPKCDPCIPYEERLQLAEGKDLKKSAYTEEVLLYSRDGSKLI